jgi:uncharacterized protein DUF2442
LAISVEDRERYAGARAIGERNASDTSAVTAVRYLPRRDAVELEFVSGGLITVPRRTIPALADAPTEALKHLAISPAGDAVACHPMDIDVDVAGLVEAVFGARLLAAAFGRRGGRQTSKAKAKAVRANGAKGGRPRNRSTRV